MGQEFQCRHPRTHPPEAGNPQRLDRQPDRRAIPGDAEEQQDHGHPEDPRLAGWTATAPG
ncbi:hypothetical protein ACPA9J_12850 [Pseudomonas aeruginosa]